MIDHDGQHDGVGRADAGWREYPIGRPAEALHGAVGVLVAVISGACLTAASVLLVGTAFEEQVERSNAGSRDEEWVMLAHAGIAVAVLVILLSILVYLASVGMIEGATSRALRDAARSGADPRGASASPGSCGHCLRILRHLRVRDRDCQWGGGIRSRSDDFRGRRC